MEQGTNSFCFIWLFKIMKLKTLLETSRGASYCAHWDGLDNSQDDKQLEGPNDWMCLAVIGCPLSSQIDELQWSGQNVFRWRFKEVSGIVEIMLEGMSCCAQAQFIFCRYSEILSCQNFTSVTELGANLLHPRKKKRKNPAQSSLGLSTGPDYSASAFVSVAFGGI